MVWVGKKIKQSISLIIVYHRCHTWQSIKNRILSVLHNTSQSTKLKSFTVFSNLNFKELHFLQQTWGWSSFHPYSSVLKINPCILSEFYSQAPYCHFTLLQLIWWNFYHFPLSLSQDKQAHALFHFLWVHSILHCLQERKDLQLYSKFSLLWSRLRSTFDDETRSQCWRTCWLSQKTEWSRPSLGPAIWMCIKIV